MDHSRNTATVIDTTYGGEGCTLKVYVHDEVGRFVTVAQVSLGTREMQEHLRRVLLRREELDQGTLFDAPEAHGATNVRWMPPQP